MKDSLQSKKDQANQILADINQKADIIESRLKQSADLLSKMSSDSSQAKVLNSSLDRIIKTTSSAVEKFREEKKTVTRLLSEVNSFYDKKYLPLYRQITNKDSGLQQTLNIAKKNSDDLGKIKTTIQYQYEIIKKSIADLKQKSRELSTIDTNIRKFYERAKTGNENIQTFERTILAIEKSVTKVNSEIQQLFQKSKDDYKAIHDLLESSNSDIENIKVNSAESSKVLGEIKAIYGLAAETGLSGEFERQRMKLGEKLEKWESRIYFVTWMLFICVVLFFFFELYEYDWNLTKMDANFYLRFLVLSPVVFYLYFCSSQHALTKKLYDRYAFKTALAMTIQNHIKMLLDEEKFAEHKEKILDFVLHGFRTIYSEPYKSDDIKLGLKVHNIEMNLESKLTEKIEQLKNEFGK